MVDKKLQKIRTDLGPDARAGRPGRSTGEALCLGGGRPAHQGGRPVVQFFLHFFCTRSPSSCLRSSIRLQLLISYRLHGEYTRHIPNNLHLGLHTRRFQIGVTLMASKLKLSSNVIFLNLFQTCPLTKAPADIS